MATQKKYNLGDTVTYRRAGGSVQTGRVIGKYKDSNKKFSYVVTDPSGHTFREGNYTFANLSEYDDAQVGVTAKAIQPDWIIPIYGAGEKVLIKNSDGTTRVATVVAAYRDGGCWVAATDKDNALNASNYRSYRQEDFTAAVSRDTSYSGKVFLCQANVIMGLAEKGSNQHSSALEVAKSDFHDAGYRVAGKQISKAARGALLSLLKSKGAKNSHIKAVKELLETPMGLALISFGLGWGLKYMPGLSEDSRAQFLAKEFRVDAMSAGGDAIAGQLMTVFLPMLHSNISGLRVPDLAQLEDGERRASDLLQDILEATEANYEQATPRTTTAGR